MAFRRALILACLAGAATGSSETHGETVVLVYDQPGISGTGVGDCSDESANLQSIVQYVKNVSPYTIGTEAYDFSYYRVDNSLSTFADPALGAKLAAASFFFMIDMETDVAGWDSAAQATVKAWVAGGGVMLMTGTSGSKDADFLNDIFGWDVSSVTCSSVSLNTANAAGTVFAMADPVVNCPSATDHLDCGSQDCLPIYGTKSSNAVSVFTHGRGKVVYVGYDYWNTGFGVVIAGGTHKNCAARTDPFVPVLPLSLKLAQALAEEAAAPAPAPPSSPEAAAADCPCATGGSPAGGSPTGANIPAGLNRAKTILGGAGNLILLAKSAPDAAYGGEAAAIAAAAEIKDAGVHVSTVSVGAGGPTPSPSPAPM